MEDKVEFSIRKIAQSKLSTETILQRISIFNGFSITVKTGGVCHLY